MIRLATSSQLSGWNRNLPLTTEAEIKNEIAYKKINKNTWKVGGLRPKPLLKDFPPQLFFSEFWKLFKNSIFHGTPPMVSKLFHWFLSNNNIEIEWAKSWGVFRTQTNVYNEAFLCIVNVLTIFKKISIRDVWLGSLYATERDVFRTQLISKT